MSALEAGAAGQVDGEHAVFLLEAPAPVRRMTAGRASVLVYRDEESMGLASAISLASEQVRLVEENGATSFMIMAAPSAFAFYAAYLRIAHCSPRLQSALRQTYFFQFDDYRLPFHHPASFRFLLCERFFNPLSAYCDPDKVRLFDGSAANMDDECRAYANQILDHGPDLQLKGTGENGHWGFHEPGIPLHGEPAFLKVALTQENVAQQMRDHPRLFPEASLAPREAYTANVPLFMRTRALIEDNVPQSSKAFALLACYGSAKVDCLAPSSMLKTHARPVVRTTEAAAWALMEYHDTGSASEALLQRLASGLYGQASPSACAKIRRTLVQMNVRCC